MKPRGTIVKEEISLCRVNQEVLGALGGSSSGCRRRAMSTQEAAPAWRVKLPEFVYLYIYIYICIP